MFIPDCQVKPGISVDYLKCLGRFIVDKQPDIIVNAGDFADMPSLSSYDVGKKSFEGRRYVHDIEAAHRGMEALLEPIAEYNQRQRKNSKKQYKPRMVLTLGNHEDRITRAINSDPKLDGVLSIEDLRYKEYGWEVFPFLEVVVIEGIAFSHFFTSGLLGRPVVSATACLNKKHMSCIQGHQQGRQVATAITADGRQLTSIIAGSFYEHMEDYMGPQGNNHWRGVVMLYEVANGSFDEGFISLNFLKNRYKSA